MTPEKASELLNWYGYKILNDDGFFYKDIEVDIGGRKFMTRFAVNIDVVTATKDFGEYDAVMVQKALLQISDKYGLGD